MPPYGPHAGQHNARVAHPPFNPHNMRQRDAPIPAGTVRTAALVIAAALVTFGVSRMVPIGVVQFYVQPAAEPSTAEQSIDIG